MGVFGGVVVMHTQDDQCEPPPEHFTPFGLLRPERTQDTRSKFKFAAVD